MNGDNSNNTKRARTSSPIRPNEFHITNLPNGLFADIAAYLPKPSRVLFAIVMTTGQTKLKSIGMSLVSQIILSSTNWESLDFGDIERSLSNRLTDDDVSNILIYIDAKSTLKSLMLTGCININGSGLRPLRESTVLEKVDLSLVGYHEIPEIEPPPKISESCVLPIMDSIIEKQGNSLHYLQMSIKWREHQSPELAQTLEKFHLLMNSRRIRCFKCDRHIEHGEGYKWYLTNDDEDQEDWYGLQNYTCCKCLKHFCYDPEDEHENQLLFCSRCEREYCKSCAPTMNRCIKCDNNICLACGDSYRCDSCEQLVCGYCIFTCDCCKQTNCAECKDPRHCMYDDCDVIHCESCFDGKEYDVMVCEVCNTEACMKCRVRHGHYGIGNDGGTCKGQGCIAVRYQGRIERSHSTQKRLESESEILLMKLGERSEGDPSLESSLESVSTHHEYKCHTCASKFRYSQVRDRKVGDKIEDEPRFCANCLKDCCITCVPKEEWLVCGVDQCDAFLCKECGDSCDKCDKKVCESCIDKCPSCQLTRCEECVTFLDCYICSKKHCAECFDGKENDVTHCDTCERDYCQGCRKSCKVKEEKDACSRCGCIRKGKTYIEVSSNTD